MSSLFAALWIAGALGLVAWAVRARAISRRADRPASRAAALAAAGALVALAGGAAFALAFAPAQRGWRGGESSPARARLFLHSVEIALAAAIEGDDPADARIGWAPDSDLRLPSATAREARGGDLARVRARSDRGLELAAADGLDAEGSGVLLAVGPRGGDTDALASAADRLARRCRAADRPGEARPVSVRGGSSALLVLCESGAPRLALAVVAAGGGTEARARVVPLARAGGRFRLLQRDLGPGELVQIGSNADAAPGVDVWEVPAPPGGTRLLVAPGDPGASCSDWNRALTEADGDAGTTATPGEDPRSSPAADRKQPPTPAIGVDSASSWRAAAGSGEAASWPHGEGGSRCVLPFASPFAFELRRLVADSGGLALRAGWAASVLILPALAWLLWLAADRRSRLTRARLADALALAAPSLLLAGLAAVRLLWAHRIDMMRDYQAFGWRTEDNLYWIGLAAATLAATAAARAEPSLPGTRRLLLATLGWTSALALAICATGGHAPSLRDLTVAAVSLGLGIGPAVLAARPDLARTLRARAPGPVAALVVLAVAAVLAPRVPGVKLAIAWAIPLVFFSAVRRRPSAALVAGGAAALGALALDPGLATALVLPGLVAALVFAARDACWDARDLGAVGAYRARHAPVALIHAVLVLVTGLAALWLALSESDREAGAVLTSAALHAPLIAAGFLAPAAVLVARRSGARAALPWAAAALVLLLVFTARGALLDAVLTSDTQAARRIAQVVEPGYALLRDPARFSAGLTAWRETAIPAAGDPWIGQGSFGAQLIDPGVLLSVENDYLAILVLREAGAAGILILAILLGGAALFLSLIAGERFRRGSAAERRRVLAALLLAVLVFYQPLAALGALPLTGIPWPGLGIDGPTDWFVLIALFLWIALWGEREGGADELDAYDAELRRARRFARLRRIEVAAASIAIAAALAVLARAALDAAARPATPRGTDAALAYARDLTCDAAAAEFAAPSAVQAASGRPPERLLGRPVDPATRRYHAELGDRWRRARPAATAALARLRDEPDPGCATGDAGEERCTVRVPLGLPELVLRVDRAAGDHPPARVHCTIGPAESHLRQLRLPSGKPYQGVRVRLVSRAMGAAARDVGELVSGAMAVRLRPGAEPLELPRDPAGLVAAGRVVLGEGVSVVAADDGARVELAAGADLRLLARAPSGAWHRVPPAGGAAPLAELSLLVVGGRAARGVWLFRPRSRWPIAPDGPAVVDPLLADDVGSQPGRSRRAYLYGGLLPEVGWVNRHAHRASLGLDGWVRVALDQYRTGAAPVAARCGALDPPRGEIAQVCALARDGAVECRVSLQPELALRLRHLTELVSLDPGRFAPRSGSPAAPPLGGSFALLRGDSGEILAQGEFAPGRESSLYAPATPALERRLIRAREDRDPDTGRRLSPARRGEASGEKLEWNQAIPVGSLLKPLMARAFERADPTAARQLWLRGAPYAGASCRLGRAHAVFGHCPPTDSVWNRREGEGMAMSDFLSRSANWYLAAIGLAGTALPDGRVGLGEREVSLAELFSADVGDHPSGAALWTEQAGRAVLTRGHAIDLEALAATPMWREFEALWGRPLCLSGDKAGCRRAAARADLCATRALPVPEPTADLRHLIALGPGGFDFYPERSGRGGAAPVRPARRVPSHEYLQFLRGSGVHPLGSLLQVTDAFNRLSFEGAAGASGDPAGVPLDRSAGLRRGGNDSRRYRLAASWFPVPPAITSLPRDCVSAPATGDPVRDGLCEALRSGTASRALGGLLSDPGLLVYGAKTGTIDSLADIAERPAACRRFNQAHTLTDRPRRAADQPYWLPCGKQRGTAGQRLDDSLLVLSFAVPTATGAVPLTLGLRFRRAGAGFATEVASHYLTVVRDYFAPAPGKLP